jgi:hypothetical protein
MFRRTTEPAGSLATCWRRALDAALAGLLMCVLACATVPAAHAADDPRAMSSELSNQAFALLNSLTASDAAGNANSAAKMLLGPVASFAGDAQTLSQALGACDNGGARRAIASLDSDAASVDAALKAHHGAIKADRWDALKGQLSAIEKDIPPAPASVAPASVPPSTAGEAAAASAPAAPPADIGGPTIKIESRRVEGSITQLKGYFEGAALRSAGIYEGAQNIKPLKVDHVIGRQKVDFQLSLRDADIATNLRVIDQAGRMATASVFAEDSTAMASTGTESGVEVDRGTGSTSGEDTAEIPSASAPPPGELGSEGSEEPASRADEGLGSAGPVGGLVGGGIVGRSIGRLGGGIGAPMGNIQINIEAINPVNPVSHLYQVVGQIIGHGVRRAGIYVDGRLVKRLPASSGANVSNFHTTFMMNGGTATIRAFGAANQYVESSITMPPGMTSAPPVVVAPYGMNPYNPYWMNPYEMDPYGSAYGFPYGTPYGASPSYGINISPYGITRYPISPYGATPYAVNPYAPSINPYGNAMPMNPAGR